MITVRIWLSRLSRIVVVVNAIGIRIARSEIPTFFVKARLRELAGAIDNGRGHSRSHESCDDNSGVDQGAFHPGLLTKWRKS
jgi:hypothetical protein